MTPWKVLLRVLRFFLPLSFYVHALIYHRSYKIFKIDNTLWITHFLRRSRKCIIHKLQATNSVPLRDLDFESDSLLTAQQTQEIPVEYLSISYVTYQVIRKNCAVWIQIGYLARIKAGISFITLFAFTLQEENVYCLYTPKCCSFNVLLAYLFVAWLCFCNLHKCLLFYFCLTKNIPSSILKLILFWKLKPHLHLIYGFHSPLF